MLMIDSDSFFPDESWKMPELPLVNPACCRRPCAFATSNL